MAFSILFQGDSVTDAGRTGDAGPLGAGYPLLIAQRLEADGTGEAVLNRAISGNRTKDLAARWDADCVALAPDLLSVLIGVNDCWRKYDNDDETPIEQIEANYTDILSRYRAVCPQGKLILMEPFVLPLLDRPTWRVTLDPIIHLTRRLAVEYGAKLVPLDGLLNAAGVELGFEAVCSDGVHPTPLGHQIIADFWLKAYREMK